MKWPEIDLEGAKAGGLMRRYVSDSMMSMDINHAMPQMDLSDRCVEVKWSGVEWSGGLPRVQDPATAASLGKHGTECTWEPPSATALRE